MSAATPPCRIETAADGFAVRLAGRWSLARLAELQAALDAALAEAGRGGAPLLRLDGSELEGIDTAAALLLLSRTAAAGFDPVRAELAGFVPSHRRIVEVVRERLGDVAPLPAVPARGSVAALGASAVALWGLLRNHLAFFGLAAAALWAVAQRPAALRSRELFAQLHQTAVTAIPVAALVTFLIGVVVAYLLGLQAEKYGANIFVVDGVALGTVREFSPLLVATIVAGRSGAAFTAQLGTMKLTEEIDAIRTLGLSAEQVLLVPRVLALMIAMPVLVFVGNVFGLAGAAFVCDLMLDITPSTFVERMHATLSVRHYVIGLAKAPVFAMAIAVIGCSMGFTVSRDTRSIGINTTSTVVQAIVAVILLDAFFAVLFQELDL